MESLAYIQENSPLNGLELKIIADLMLNQRIPLPHKGINTQYNVMMSFNFNIKHCANRIVDGNIKCLCRSR